MIRPFYQARAEHALTQVRECFEGVPCHVHKPEGAFFMWLWFPGLPITNRQLYERLKERNVLVVTGHYFFPGVTGPWRHTDECIRVSYAQDESTVAAGLRIIAEEVRRAHAEAR